jgi:hypothetical protein
VAEADHHDIACRLVSPGLSLQHYQEAMFFIPGRLAETMPETSPGFTEILDTFRRENEVAHRRGEAEPSEMVNNVGVGHLEAMP